MPFGENIHEDSPSEKFRKDPDMLAMFLNTHFVARIATIDSKQSHSMYSMFMRSLIRFSWIQPRCYEFACVD